MLRNKLHNSVIVNVQKSASLKFGADSARTIEIVRACDAELQKCSIAQFPQIEAKYVSI